MGINGLSPHHVILDFYAKPVTIVMLEMGKLEWEGNLKPTSLRIVLSIMPKR